MKFVIVGRNIDVTPGLKAAVEEKIGKLDKKENKIERRMPLYGAFFLYCM